MVWEGERVFMVSLQWVGTVDRWSDCRVFIDP
jgi:hypothetical protein